MEPRTLKKLTIGGIGTACPLFRRIPAQEVSLSIDGIFTASDGRATACN